MSDPHLLFEDGCASCLLLSHYPLLLQLRTPEALDAVCGGAELTVLQVELSAQQLVLPLHIPELGLHFQELPAAPPHRLPQEDGGHPLVVQHGEGAQVTVRQQVGMMRQPHGSDVGTAAHGCDAAPVHGPAGPAERHGAFRVGSSGAHGLVIAQVHGPGCRVGSIERLDVFHGERLTAATPTPTVGPPMAQSGGPRQARGPRGAALYVAYSSGTAVHVL